MELAAEKITDIRMVGPLAIGDGFHQFRDQEVHVEVALAMCMRSEIDRHALVLDRKIGAVVQVHAAQEILVRLAPAGVLSRDHPRYDFYQFPHPQQRPGAEVVEAHDALRGGIGGADQVDRTPPDQYLLTCFAAGRIVVLLLLLLRGALPRKQRQAKR